ncbi:unnamed protein product [Amoebophrya sp. A25]|nr:unnamed protein product [Amoebophrya sp. A25]|eukprot:GSA25T00008503001.1
MAHYLYLGEGEKVQNVPPRGRSPGPELRSYALVNEQRRHCSPGTFRWEGPETTRERVRPLRRQAEEPCTHTKIFGSVGPTQPTSTTTVVQSSSTAREDATLTTTITATSTAAKSSTMHQNNMPVVKVEAHPAGAQAGMRSGGTFRGANEEVRDKHRDSTGVWDLIHQQQCERDAVAMGTSVPSVEQGKPSHRSPRGGPQNQAGAPSQTRVLHAARVQRAGKAVSDKINRGKWTGREERTGREETLFEKVNKPITSSDAIFGNKGRGGRNKGNNFDSRNISALLSPRLDAGDVRTRPAPAERERHAAIYGGQNVAGLLRSPTSPRSSDRALRIKHLNEEGKEAEKFKKQNSSPDKTGERLWPRRTEAVKEVTVAPSWPEYYGTHQILKGAMTGPSSSTANDGAGLERPRFISRSLSPGRLNSALVTGKVGSEVWLASPRGNGDKEVDAVPTTTSKATSQKSQPCQLRMAQAPRYMQSTRNSRLKHSIANASVILEDEPQKAPHRSANFQKAFYGTRVMDSAKGTFDMPWGVDDAEPGTNAKTSSQRPQGHSNPVVHRRVKHSTVGGIGTHTDEVLHGHGSARHRRESEWNRFDHEQPGRHRHSRASFTQGNYDNLSPEERNYAPPLDDLEVAQGVRCFFPQKDEEKATATFGNLNHQSPRPASFMTGTRPMYRPPVHREVPHAGLTMDSRGVASIIHHPIDSHRHDEEVVTREPNVEREQYFAGRYATDQDAARQALFPKVSPPPSSSRASPIKMRTRTSQLQVGTMLPKTPMLFLSETDRKLISLPPQGQPQNSGSAAPSFVPSSGSANRQVHFGSMPERLGSVVDFSPRLEAARFSSPDGSRRPATTINLNLPPAGAAVEYNTRDSCKRLSSYKNPFFSTFHVALGENKHTQLQQVALNNPSSTSAAQNAIQNKNLIIANYKASNEELAKFQEQMARAGRATLEENMRKGRFLSYTRDADQCPDPKPMKQSAVVLGDRSYNASHKTTTCHHLYQTSALHPKEITKPDMKYSLERRVNVGILGSPGRAE